MKPEDIPAWCFLTGQFLLRFERNKRANHYSDVYQDFLKQSETNTPLSDFIYINPGVVIKLCYGLLVYPVEYWNRFLKDEINTSESEHYVKLHVGGSTKNDQMEAEAWHFPLQIIF